MAIFAIVLAAATAVVSGVVHDRTTGQPMPKVDVRIGAHHAVTNGKGAYTIKGVALGRQTITFTSSDVPSQRFSVMVKGRLGSGFCSPALSCALTQPDANGRSIPASINCFMVIFPSLLELSAFRLRQPA